MKQKPIGFYLLGYFWFVSIFIIAASSWMIYLKNGERWYGKITSNVSTTPLMLKKSWESYPLVDIIVQDAQDPCPSEFPEEVIYEIFPGSRESCEIRDDDHISIEMDKFCPYDPE